MEHKDYNDNLDDSTSRQINYLDIINHMNDLDKSTVISEFINILNKYFHIKGSRILELSSNLGRYSMELALRGANCTSIDISEEDLCLDIETADKYNINDCKFQKADGFSLNFNDKQFDIVFIAGTAEYFEDDTIIEMLKAMSRIGKYVITIVPYSGSTIYRISKVFLHQQNSLRSGAERDFLTLEKLLKSSGLTKLHECIIGYASESLCLKTINSNAIPAVLSENLRKMFDKENNIGNWLVTISSNDDESIKKFNNLNSANVICFNNDTALMKVNKPLVTIVCPFYNSEDYIPNVVNTLSDISYDNIEIIFVNDGSNDKSSEILKTCCNKNLINKNFKILDLTENKGTFHARYEGVKNALGEYIFFVDCDDVTFYDGISRLVYDIKNFDSNVMLPVSSTLMNKGSFIGSIWQHLLLPKTIEQIIIEIYNLTGKVSISNTLHNKNILLKAYTEIDASLKKAGVSRLINDEDMIVINHLILMGYVKQIIPIYYSLRGYNISNASSTSKDIESRINDMPIRFAYTISYMLSKNLIEKNYQEIYNIMYNKAVEIYGDSLGSKFMEVFDLYSKKFMKI